MGWLTGRVAEAAEMKPIPEPNYNNYKQKETKSLDGYFHWLLLIQWDIVWVEVK